MNINTAKHRWPEIGLTVLIAAVTYMALGRYAAIVVAIALAVIWLGAVLFERAQAPKQGIQGFASLLSVVALLLAGYWYFIERKGYPKLNVEPAITAWPTAENGLLIWSSIKMTNVGNMALQFRASDKITVQIGQVSPLTGKQGTALLESMAEVRSLGKKKFDLLQTEVWPSRATFHGPISAVIEAGETENLYFKSVIPCLDNMVVAVTVTVPKKLHLVGSEFNSSENVSWIAQSVYETKAKCSNRKVQK